MGDVLKSLEQYFEFLVLGFILTGILGATARVIGGRRWAQLRILFFPDLVGKEHPKLRAALHGGAVLGGLFLLGFIANVLGYWLLQPAHIHVVHYTSTHLRQESDFVHPDAMFFARPVARSLDKDKHVAFQEDLEQQLRWEMQEKKSYDEETSGIIRFVRIVRGLVVASILLLICTLLVLFFGPRNVRGARWLVGLPVSFVFYYLAMGMYWQFETNTHRTVWASKAVLQELKAAGKASNGQTSIGKTKRPN